MRAIGIPAAGAFDQLGVVTIGAPTAGPGEVVVRVVASALNPADLKVLRGEFAGRVLHARTRPLVTGYDFSGVVEACGGGVTDLHPGDEVFGHLAYASSNRQGAFGERIAVARAAIGRKPSAVDHRVAAALATSGLTALQALRDVGRLQPGGRALVIGAAGGVGSLAIGVARALGATVTAVCSTYAIDFVRGLGADEVVDRRARDPRELTGPFDVILDAAAAYSYGALCGALAAGGTYVTTLPSAGWLGGKLLAMFSSKRCRMVVVRSVSADLEQLAAWVSGGTRVPIDATFPVRELASACAKMADGELRGRIAIDVEHGL
jgi:NADPH:quinone reductase-like Zn-dependent oxidoreductase